MSSDTEENYYDSLGYNKKKNEIKNKKWKKIYFLKILHLSFLLP